MARINRVLDVSTPWLATPPSGYGGIERVVDVRVEGLRALGIEVDVVGVFGSKVGASSFHASFEEEQYSLISHPYEAQCVQAAHFTKVQQIFTRGDYDIVQEDVGGLWGFRDVANSLHGAPVVGTIHGPLYPPDLWRTVLPSLPSLRVVGISKSQLREHRNWLGTHLARPAVIHNAIRLEDYPFAGDQKGEYLLVMARITPDKGIREAIDLGRLSGRQLVIAGNVAGLDSPEEIWEETQKGEKSQHWPEPDWQYWLNEVAPFVAPPGETGDVTFVGSVGGQAKLDLLSGAAALVNLIQWEEPFGLVVIEAGAMGTPVLANNRGAMSEIIVDGQNGILARRDSDIKTLLDEACRIPPSKCRDYVEQNFSPLVMAEEYLKAYEYTAEQVGS